ncbi:MAG: Succinate dehydrogenase cytochrome b subunit [Cytophagales bacterium]|jgi:succinate dehydrogenase / fumarate reductase cytochrome b subunit|nr:succinate dehydrogenase cytochrome b subunit [Bacteroidota bacterium]MBS1980197.1 succinate dehydrogenase cytochrome b subunit [Bacteroidota bacterium]WHZ08714.1 MAG: Succinate dehydrogenase cytochrome b subunit [Cytophagales bacterium]
MKWLIDLFTSSLGRKLLMALTGLFLISFLVIHCTINAMIFYNDGGTTFSHWGHFMGTNPVIRTLEVGLVAGFLIHIFQGLLLWKRNHQARPVKYSVSKDPKSTWYSRSMGLLGTLLLLFLIMHTSHFWIPNRTHQFTQGEELPLYNMMFEVFSNPWVVFFYVVGCVSLFWHLLHGFASAFQTLGLNHLKYNGIISFIGTAFSIIVPFLFALMPIAVYLKWIN